MFLPRKKSVGWFVFAGAILLINASSLLMSRGFLNVTLDLPTIGSILAISLLAGILCFAGFFGLPLFSLLFAVGNIGGAVYLLYMAITRISEGWTDLTSVAGYLVFSGIGAAFGMGIQLIVSLIRSIRKH